MDYLLGIIFIIFFILFLRQIGNMMNKEASFSFKLILGYITYSFFQALIGIFVQVFRIDWAIYCALMLLMVGVLLYLSTRKIAWRECVNSVNLKKHMRKYAVIYIIAGICTIFAVMNVSYLWVGNHQDDGWYLMKVANAPYLGGNYDINYANGFQDHLILSRAINTFELDYSFWAFIFRIYPAVFCKVIISYVNYFIILNVIKEFACRLFSSFKQIESKHLTSIGLILAPILLLSLNQETLQSLGLLNMQDGWHYSIAIWYGSGMTRCLAVFILLLPWVGLKTPNIKRYMIYYILCCTMLVSKASQALPAIYLSTLCMVVIYIYENFCTKKKTLLILGLFLGISLIPAFLDSTNELRNFMNEQIMGHLQYPVVLLSIIVIFLSFLLKNKVINKWNLVIGTLYLGMFLPKVNNVFVNLSFYTFVEGRTITMLVFLLYVTAMIYVVLLLLHFKISLKIIQGSYVVIGIICCCVYISAQRTEIGMKNTISIISNNSKLLPRSTIELSEELEILSEGNSLTVMTPGWVLSYNQGHAMSTTLRINAPHIQVISALQRFDGVSEESIYNGFDIGEQMIFEHFVKYPVEGAQGFKELLQKYPMDVIVTTNLESKEAIEKQFDYTFIKDMDYPKEGLTYYILKK